MRLSRSAVERPWLRRAGMAAGGGAVLALCLLARWYWQNSSASAKPPSARAAGRASSAGGSEDEPPGPVIERPQIVAVVNRTEISRNDLGRECLRRHGTDLLEQMVNKQLIVDACRQRKLVVSGQEVDAEIEREAARFNVAKDQWLRLLKRERQISPSEYAQEIIWPYLALRKLAADRLTVSQDELAREYESYYGPAVRVRLIACDSLESARSIQQQVQANPDEFGAVAKDKSTDVNSAAAKGLIPPIRKHMGDPQVEQAAFAMRPGEISDVLRIGSQFVLLKCEEHLEPRNIPLAEVETMLRQTIIDRKLRQHADAVFRELQEQAQIENVLNNPARSQQLPGVAALVNGRKITILELAERCIERHGREVLENLIGRRLLDQELARRQLTVSQADLDAELAQIAQTVGLFDKNGRPDPQAWLKVVAEEQKMSAEIYLEDVVWPSAALKRLVLAGGGIEITDEDMQRAFEANFGPRVRCLAIMTDNQRRATEAWELARRNPDPAYFGELSEQYSSDPAIRSLRGEIPPIQKHGGEPLLENEAFQLRDGELSSVVQLGQYWVVLLCLGRTEPKKVGPDEVQQMLHDDIHEKKLRVAMAAEFNRLHAESYIDNNLLQTSHSPRSRTADGALQPVSVAPRLERVDPAPAAAPQPRAGSRPVRLQ